MARNCTCLSSSPTIPNAEVVPLLHNPYQRVLWSTVRGNVVPSFSRIIHFQEKSGGDYPLTQHYMLEGRNRQQHHTEHFKSYKPASFYNKFYMGVLGEFPLISIWKRSNVLLLISMQLIVQKTGVFHTLCTDYNIKYLLYDMLLEVINIQIIE